MDDLRFVRKVLYVGFAQLRMANLKNARPFDLADGPRLSPLQLEINLIVSELLARGLNSQPNENGETRSGSFFRHFPSLGFYLESTLEKIPSASQDQLLEIVVMRKRYS